MFHEARHWSTTATETDHADDARGLSKPVPVGVDLLEWRWTSWLPRLRWCPRSGRLPSEHSTPARLESLGLVPNGIAGNPHDHVTGRFHRILVHLRPTLLDHVAIEVLEDELLSVLQHQCGPFSPPIAAPTIARRSWKFLWVIRRPLRFLWRRSGWNSIGGSGFILLLPPR